MRFLSYLIRSSLILKPEDKKFRGQLKDYLNKYNIFAKWYYDFIVFNQENPINFPNSLNLSKYAICLSIGERVNYIDVEYIADLIDNFFDDRIGWY